MRKVDDQVASNYTYDPIGNLIDDNQEHIDNIEWTIYGKIRRITRDAGWNLLGRKCEEF